MFIFILRLCSLDQSAASVCLEGRPNIPCTILDDIRCLLDLDLELTTVVGSGTRRASYDVQGSL